MRIQLPHHSPLVSFRRYFTTPDELLKWIFVVTQFHLTLDAQSINLEACEKCRARSETPSRSCVYSIAPEICTRFCCALLCCGYAIVHNEFAWSIYSYSSGCFAGTGAIVRLPQCQWSKPDGYGKISQCITTTKHSKTKTVCIFLGIYCIYIMSSLDSFRIISFRGRKWDDGFRCMMPI